MKKRLLSILLTLTLCFSALSLGLLSTGCNEKPKPQKPISILAIGSSYLRNSMDHVYPILDSLGYDEIILGNIYSSGCKINKHMENIANDTAFYEYRVVINGKLQQKPVPNSNKKYDGGAHNGGTGKCYKMSTALKERKWDYVIINQGATEGHIKETYAQLPDYFNYIKSQAPNAKILFNVPWTLSELCFLRDQSAYPDILSAIQACDFSQEKQYEMIVDCAKTQVEPLDFYKIIPQVTVVANCRTVLSDNVIIGSENEQKRYGHASEGFGRYMVGLSLVSCVTGEDISNIKYKPASVTDEQKTIAIESVLNALAKPYEITQSQYIN